MIWCAFTLLVCADLPAEQSRETQPPGGTYTFKSNVNEVLVPVLVRDRQGREVGNLKKEDFQLWDNGKPQAISGLMIQKRERCDRDRACRNRSAHARRYSAPTTGILSQTVSSSSCLTTCT